MVVVVVVMLMVVVVMVVLLPDVLGVKRIEGSFQRF